MSVANSFRKRATAIRVVLIAALLLPGLGVAQIGEMRLPISLDADSTDYDGKNSMLMFTGLRLSQGRIGVEADEGRASKLDFEDSVWRFSGNVRIDVENGHIECDSADVTFTNHQLILAIIDGTPATFELTRPGSPDVTYAEARNLRYGLATATLEFSGDAIIREAGNEIASEFLAYNIVEQRIKAVSSGESDDKVRIRYTPPPVDDSPPAAEESEEAEAEAETSGEEPPAEAETAEPPEDEGADSPDDGAGA